MSNDFSGDSNCVALWRFESGALEADSKGSNTLTNFNTVLENTTTFKEGGCAADFERSSSEYLEIANSSLDAGFPLKSGATNVKISICFWVMHESVASTNQTYFSAYAVNKQSFLMGKGNASNTPNLVIGTGTGSTSETLYGSTVSGFTTGRWYHIAATFDDSDKSWKFVVWDDTAGSKFIDASGTASNNINIEDSEIRIGQYAGTNYFDGIMDELVIFNDILTAGEIDQIRAGTYGAAGSTLSPIMFNLKGNLQVLSGGLM